MSKTIGKILASDLELLKKNSILPIIVREDPLINCEIETDDANAIIEFNAKKKI